MVRLLSTRAFMVGLAPPSLLGSGSRHCYGINLHRLALEGWICAVLKTASKKPVQAIAAMPAAKQKPKYDNLVYSYSDSMGQLLDELKRLEWRVKGSRVEERIV
jgi:hypothetical protein